MSTIEAHDVWIITPKYLKSLWVITLFHRLHEVPFHKLPLIFSLKKNQLSNPHDKYRVANKNLVEMTWIYIYMWVFGRSVHSVLWIHILKEVKPRHVNHVMESLYRNSYLYLAPPVIHSITIIRLYFCFHYRYLACHITLAKFLT